MRKSVFIIIASMLVLCACGKEEVVAEPQVEIEETAEETEPEVIEETVEEEAEPEVIEETAEEEAEPEVIEETVEEELEPEVVVEETVEEQAKESETPTENGSTGTDGSVPVTKEVAEQQPQTPPPVEATTPQPTTPAPTTPQKSLEEIQAECDRINEEISKITDPNHPDYGVTYGVGTTHGSFR